VAAVDGILPGLHIPNAGFTTWARSSGLAQLAELQAALQSAGLFNVPAYVVEDDVFYGRQHLPMVEWLLTGRGGEVPI
jgi:2-hydroxychromene-2-carboxylate isomerase